MHISKFIDGRILYCDKNLLYLARGRKILQSVDRGNCWEICGLLPGSLLDRISGQFPLMARLLRKGSHFLLPFDSNKLIFADKNTYISSGNEMRLLDPLNGSRPLVICESEGSFYYGEYRSNSQRSNVHVWQWQPGNPRWSKVWTFTSIRHIHGIFNDPYSGAIWVTTGDDDSEAGIWCTNDGFNSLQHIAGGTQQYRVIQLIFTKDYIYFGSDAPNEENHIYRYDRQSKQIEQLANVNGSVFYGCKVGGSLFLSTAVEPSLVNKHPNAEVWRTDNGSNWYPFLEFKKDYLPMRYFQYGQVFFPAGPGDENILYCSPFATTRHGKTLIIDIDKSKNQFLGDGLN